MVPWKGSMKHGRKTMGRTCPEVGSIVTAGLVAVVTTMGIPAFSKTGAEAMELPLWAGPITATTPSSTSRRATLTDSTASPRLS